MVGSYVESTLQNFENDVFFNDQISTLHLSTFTPNRNVLKQK